MNPQHIIDILSLTVYTTAELAAPMLIAALVIGLIVSIFQAATQINEATMTFLPKMAGIILVLIFVSPWMIQKMKGYTANLYDKIPQIVRMDKVGGEGAP